MEVLRKAIESGSETCVLLINYTADGTPFWNQLFIAPLKDTDDTIVNFVSGSKIPWLRYTFFLALSLCYPYVFSIIIIILALKVGCHDTYLWYWRVSLP